MKRLRLVSLSLLVILSLCCIFTCWQGIADPLTPEQKERIILKPEMYDVFYRKADRIYLNGFWKFKREVNVLKQTGNRLSALKNAANPPSDAGLEHGYYKPEFDVSSWGEIPVPFPWNYFIEQQKTKIPFAGVGYYRTTFYIPKSREGKRAFIHFDSVQTQCKVWINGKLVGEHENSSDSFGKPWRVNNRLWLDDFEMDITAFVDPGGENTLALRVYDNGLPILYNSLPDDGGIVGPVHIEFREHIYLPEILVNPDIETSTVTLDIKGINYSEKPQTLLLKAEWLPFESKYYKPPATGEKGGTELGQVTFTPGESRHQFAVKLENPVLWDIHTPFLYHLRISGNGMVLGQTRFGFREFQVKGKRFFLNNHPLYIRASNPYPAWSHGAHILGFNHANWLRYGLKLFKEANICVLRVHTGPETRTFYDLCDELGIITQDDFSPWSRELLPHEIERVEQIEDAQLERYLAEDKGFTSESEEILGRWIVRLHNHPSVCMFTGGNELGRGNEKRQIGQAAYINNLYDFLKRHDRQKRPVTPSSGLAVWMWNTPVKADYYDYHNYAGWRVGWPDSVKPNQDWYDHLKRIYGEVDKPVINGECAGFRATLRGDIRSLWENGALNKKKYVQWVNDLAQNQTPEGFWDWIARCNYVRFTGIRSAVTSEAVKNAAAHLTRKQIHIFRRDMDFLEGFALHDISPTHFGMSTRELYLTEDQIRETYAQSHDSVEFKALQNSLSPQFVTLDMYDRHLFAGDQFETNVFVINNLYKAHGNNLTVELSLEDHHGRCIHAESIAFEDVPEHAGLKKMVAFPLAEDLSTGDYTISVRLFKHDDTMNKQTFPLFIMARSGKEAKISTSKRIALYGKATQSILDHVGVKYALLADFVELRDYEVLIIGQNSIDDTVMKSSRQIRSWLEKGGRIVCLEQDYEGPIPFVDDLRYSTGQLFGGDRFFADLIEMDHPVVEDFRPWHWELWNGKREYENGVWRAGAKGIYKCVIFPMTEDVIISGATFHRYGRKNPIIGMVAGQVKVGNGLVFFSQVLATKRYGEDSIATHYLHNLLNHTLE